MTLLEAMVALVILGASAAGFLGVFQSSARSAQAAREWLQAVATAEATLEESVRSLAEAPADAGITDAGIAEPVPGGPQASTDVRPWSDRVDDVAVRVTLPDGRAMIVHRLVRRR